MRYKTYRNRKTHEVYFRVFDLSEAEVLFRMLGIHISSVIPVLDVGYNHVSLLHLPPDWSALSSA